VWAKDPRITYIPCPKTTRRKVNVEAEQFFHSGYQPLITNIQTNDRPEPGHARVGKQEARNRGLRHLYHGLRPYALEGTTHDFLTPLKNGILNAHTV
jgi:hypothetical protein